MTIPEPITGQETGYPDWPGLGLVLHHVGSSGGGTLGKALSLWELGMVLKGKAVASARRTMGKCVGRTQNKANKASYDNSSQVIQKKET